MWAGEGGMELFLERGDAGTPSYNSILCCLLWDSASAKRKKVAATLPYGEALTSLWWALFRKKIKTHSYSGHYLEK